MDGNTDLSKIISMIMENPELINLAKTIISKGETESSNNESVNTSVPQTATEREEATATIATGASDAGTKRKRRNALLSSLKPYVSASRGKAIESMMSFVDILEVLGKG